MIPGAQFVSPAKMRPGSMYCSNHQNFIPDVWVESESDFTAVCKDCLKEEAALGVVIRILPMCMAANGGTPCPLTSKVDCASCGDSICWHHCQRIEGSYHCIRCASGLSECTASDCHEQVSFTCGSCSETFCKSHEGFDERNTCIFCSRTVVARDY